MNANKVYFVPQELRSHKILEQVVLELNAVHVDGI